MIERSVYSAFVRKRQDLQSFQNTILLYRRLQTRSAGQREKVSSLRRMALLFFRTACCSSKPAQDTPHHTSPRHARPPDCQSYRPNLRLMPRTERQRVLSRQRGYCDASVGVYYSQKQCRCPVGPFGDIAFERAIHDAKEVLTAYDGTGKAPGACLHLQSIVLARFAAGKSASLCRLEFPPFFRRKQQSGRFNQCERACDDNSVALLVNLCSWSCKIRQSRATALHPTALRPL